MSSLLLVVGDASPETIRQSLAGGPARVHVVAPTVVGALDWLSNAEGDARLRAEVRGLEAERALEGLVPVTSAAGEVDPVQAVADALSEFPATEILVAGASADLDLERALAVFRLPVRRLGPPPDARARVNLRIRKLAGGRDPGALLALIVGMNVALMVGAIALSLVALFVLWLVGAY
ncbi:MAG TPA: hypothetical protein VFW41_02390 [Gaiellaceae bacterium]|nr:hypothetical protein [Gaiellaceae bacterium]